MASDYVTCQHCGKRAYTSRKIARKAARETPNRGPAMREYRCPANESLWHNGHVTSIVRRGIVPASSAYAHTRSI
jgi:hypothetical protein